MNDIKYFIEFLDRLKLTYTRENRPRLLSLEDIVEFSCEFKNLSPGSRAIIRSKFSRKDLTRLISFTPRVCEKAIYQNDKDLLKAATLINMIDWVDDQHLSTMHMIFPYYSSKHIGLEFEDICAELHKYGTATVNEGLRRFVQRNPASNALSEFGIELQISSDAVKFKRKNPEFKP